MVNMLKQWLVGYAPLKMAAYLAHDALTGARYKMGRIRRSTGSTHQYLPLDASLAYIERTYDNYRHLAGVDRFYGVTAEVGPGDNAGVALLMRRDGCSRVDLVDRFDSTRNSLQQQSIYQALSQRYDLEAFRNAPQWDERKLSGVNWRVGVSAEEFFAGAAQNKETTYDFIGSTAVFEHLYDPLFGLEGMLKTLRPQGRMVHVVDLRDHGMFTPNHPELQFLTISTGIYKRMTQNTGRPNRVLVHRYRDFLQEYRDSTSFHFKFLVTRLVGVGLLGQPLEWQDIPEEKTRQALAVVEQFRPQLAEEFRDVANKDIAVNGFALVIYNG